MDVPNSSSDRKHQLVAVAGPTRETLSLAVPGPLSIGRRTTCDLVLNAPAVSREHAVLRFASHSRRSSREPIANSGVWTFTDLSSRHGSRINGAIVEPNRPCPLHPGDLLEIGGWTLRMVDPSAPARPSQTLVNTVQDSATTGRMVRPVQPSRDGSIAKRRLDALLQCADAMQAAPDENALGEVVVDAAVSGGGFPNVAYLTALHADGSVEIAAQRGQIVGEHDETCLSRSLIAKAADGAPAHIVTSSDQAGAHSIMQYNISEAVCAPILIGKVVEGFLYVDRRGARAGGADDAVEFICGLAQLASLAMANQRRINLERRQAMLDADLIAAGVAHRWILPPLRGAIGAVNYIGKSRPGRLGLGGDFFDVLDLGGGKVATALGDVTGKGVSASILMTAAQGFLHASLQRHSDPALAATDLNAFLCPRVGEGRFMTLWVGVFDMDSAELRYVDAGHGHALWFDSEGAHRPLRDQTSPLLGIDPNAGYTSASIKMTPGACALIVSDGLVEQPIQAGASERRCEFGLDNVAHVFFAARNDDDPVAAVFDAVVEHAGTDQLADDATAILVRWMSGNAPPEE